MLKRIKKHKISKIIIYTCFAISVIVNAYSAIVLKYFFNTLVLGFVIGMGTALFIDYKFKKIRDKDFDAKIAILIKKMNQQGYEVKENETINHNDIIELSQYKVNDNKTTKEDL